MSLTETGGSEQAEKRKAFREKMDAQLREWSAKIDELKAKADQSKADAKIEYHQRINELREQRQVVQTRLDELKATSDEKWESLKSNVRKAADDFKDALDKAAARFK